MDLIAFETIPRIDEADAILTALEELLQEDEGRRLTKSALPPVYISFVFPPETEGRFLPYPTTDDRTGLKRIVELIQKRKRGLKWPIAGVGINCTKTNILKSTLEFFAQEALQEPRQLKEENLHLFVSRSVLSCNFANLHWVRLVLRLPASLLFFNRCTQTEGWCGTR